MSEDLMKTRYGDDVWYGAGVTVCTCNTDGCEFIHMHIFDKEGVIHTTCQMPVHFAEVVRDQLDGAINARRGKRH